MTIVQHRIPVVLASCLWITAGCFGGVSANHEESAPVGAGGEPVAVALSALDGTCQQDCLGGACVDGQCQPVQIAGGASRPWFLAVDGIDVFFTAATSWTASRTSLLGGPTTRVAIGTTGIAVGGGWVVTAAEGSGEIRRAAPDSSQPDSSPPDGVVIASGQDQPVGVATDGRFVYWTNYGDGTVARIHVRPTEGELPEVLASGLNHPEPIVLRAGVAYVGGADGVSRVDIASHMMTRFASGSLVLALATDSSSVYWADFYAGTLMKAPLGGGPPVHLVGGQDQPGGLVVDDAHLFWTTYYGGTVMRSDLDGQNLTTMADGQIRPLSLAQDATALYWVMDRWDLDCAMPPCGGVMKLAK
jgi:hypothetical protein